jgi:penicillin-binding protein 1C
VNADPKEAGKPARRSMASRLRYLVVFGSLLSLVLAVVLLVVVEAFVAFTPLPESLINELKGTPTLLDREGVVVAHFPSADGIARIQIPVSLERMGEWMPKVTVGLEDHRFFRHSGVDCYAIFAAVARNLRNPDRISGASTISQQLIKLCDQRKGRKLSAKFREAVLAIKLERQWPKENILSAYLNRLDYGNRRIGPEAAAQAYFGKPAVHLTLPEAVFLAGLPQSPSRFNPWRNPAAATARFQRAADRLKVLDFEIPIDGAEAPKIATKLPHNRAERFTEALPIRPDGIHATTLDLSLQETARRYLHGQLIAINRHDVRNAAMVVIENATGAVRVLTSVATESEDAESAINGALTPRHAGSTLKPFVYLLGIDEKKLTAATLLPDTAEAVPEIFAGYDPNNYSRQFHGPVRLREALANSYNVPAVLALERVGPRRAFQYLGRWGLNPTGQRIEDSGAGFILGNLMVRPLDLAAAYAALARGGLVEDPHFLENDRELSQRLASQDATLILTDILCDNDARSSAFGRRSSLHIENHRCAAKTGTSSSYRDAWTAGFDLDHTVVVWFGNYNGRSMLNLRTVQSAAPVWSRMMRHLAQSYGSRSLPETRLASTAICSLTGLQPSQLSPGTVEEYFLPGTIPEESADPWFEIGDNGKSVIILPKNYADWCRSDFNHLAAVVRRPADVLEILSPKNGATFLYDRTLPAAQQALVLEADKEDSSWRINGQPVANPWPLQRGEWIIEARAGDLKSSARIVVE